MPRNDGGVDAAGKLAQLLQRLYELVPCLLEHPARLRIRIEPFAL